MRPVRIEVEGFAAFRDRAVVDLDEVDLFALVGPTGAGKSSVIDALVFALYGSVPRYGSKTLVYPAITQGALEARVRLDFLVGGSAYTATRVVRRTRTGATTKEARLEHGGDVLADDADGLTAAVVDLLGLDLEQFTKCVVLPQGDFARLLHDTKASRQDLLVKLLGLGLYEQVAAAARAEAKRCAQRIELLDDQLARSAGATPEALAAAVDRVADLDRLVARVDEVAPALAELDARIEQATADGREHEAVASSLQAVSPPHDVIEISDQAAEAEAAVEAAAAHELETADGLESARAERAALPDDAQLRRTLADHERVADLDERVGRGAALVEETDAEWRAATVAVESAEAADAAASTALDAARVRHAAADLARHLHAGDECPVCGNEVVELPVADTTVLAEHETARATTAATLAEAVARSTSLGATLASYRETLVERTAERDEVRARLVGAPTVDEITAMLDRAAQVDATLRDAEAADAAARRATTAARAAMDAARRRVDDARRSFVEVRDRLAVHGPPAATDDLAADWKELVQWAAATAQERAAAAATAAEERDRRARERSELFDALSAEVAAAGVTAGRGALRDACVDAAAHARAEHERLERDLAAVAVLRDERAHLDERRAVHELLAEQLGARGFESWLLDEALDVLLDGATAWLEQLSSGRYAMAADDKKQFVVVDHANADERRLARTLSGGETFLASLALALALAERVGELSSTGGAALDAIFLDEGFGTLDPDTLDVVATAIEELGATGRMVGIISHVAELAERVPVRYEITKTPGTSTIERVDG